LRSGVIQAVQAFKNNPRRGRIPEKLSALVESLLNGEYLGEGDATARAIDIKEAVILASAIVVELKKVIN